MPVKGAYKPPKPQNKGDIVLVDGGFIPGIPLWDHAAIHYSSGWCIEADPHVEAWPEPWNETPPSQIPEDVCIWLEETYGRVEWTTTTKLYNEYKDSIKKGRVAMAYYKLRPKWAGWCDDAADFAEQKLGRYFDLLSYWHYNSKQVDENEDPDRGARYYCSELVWAAYRKHGVKLDNDWPENKVTPSELANNYKTVRYFKIGNPI